MIKKYRENNYIESQRWIAEQILEFTKMNIIIHSIDLQNNSTDILNIANDIIQEPIIKIGYKDFLRLYAELDDVLINRSAGVITYVKLIRINTSKYTITATNYFR